MTDNGSKRPLPTPPIKKTPEVNYGQLPPDQVNYGPLPDAARDNIDGLNVTGNAESASLAARLDKNYREREEERRAMADKQFGKAPRRPSHHGQLPPNPSDKKRSHHGQLPPPPEPITKYSDIDI